LGFSVEKNTSGSKLSDNHVDIVIGTHALLENNDQLKNLGLVIIDEQHRFGVAQREKLLSRKVTPHLLMMTATPIPRSLAQTLFGHLEITYIAGKPPSQKKVTTQIFNENERSQIDNEIAARLKRGEPGYVICPLITETHSVQSLLDTDRKAVASEHRRLTKEFPDARITTLHGRLKSSEKESIVSDFRAGKIDILLSTTVVEVGIDNQAATWILIEEADRFGLAQLHQLRGRVGRGEKESICFLMDSGVSDKGRERLEALQKTDEGLALAEEDLRLRGPGELIGFEQSGLPPLKHFDWSEPEFFGAVFAEAKKIINDGVEKYPLIADSLKDDDKEVTLSRA
jgi:ATP-dependent DNA helicase RecG